MGKKSEDAPARKTAEQWCIEKKTEAWLFNGAQAGLLWPVGVELTEDEYNAAIHATAHVSIR